ncbi:hypothetical protein LA080_002629 [Diaporthe eres]|nr:hypothetical protein LA080_002629 [Diaporthe eres]
MGARSNERALLDARQGVFIPHNNGNPLSSQGHGLILSHLAKIETETTHSISYCAMQTVPAIHDQSEMYVLTYLHFQPSVTGHPTPSPSPWPTSPTRPAPSASRRRLQLGSGRWASRRCGPNHNHLSFFGNSNPGPEQGRVMFIPVASCKGYLVLYEATFPRSCSRDAGGTATCLPKILSVTVSLT